MNLKDLFDQITELLQKYRQANKWIEDEEEDDSDADAFNIICVVEQIRRGCLYQIGEADQIKTEELIKNLNTRLHDFNVTAYMDENDVFCIQNQYYKEYVSMKVKTDILDLCEPFNLYNEVRLDFTFRSQFFYGNLCSQKQADEVLPKHRDMLQQMRLVAVKIGCEKSVVWLRVVNKKDF